MIGTATSAASERELIGSGAGGSGPAGGSARGAPGGGPAAAFASAATESLHLKYTSKDGDVLELDYERSERIFAGVALSDGGGDRAAERSGIAGENSEAAVPAASDADGKLAKLARLRDWATQVADEVRKQQKRILEESLKQSGRFQPGGEGRFIVVFGAAEEEDGNSGDCEAGIPEYWNAENTSDRIVHFATQMAEIAGGDGDFAETILKAVADGFDQANAETGPLPGKAGELNKKTRELTFAKLSKWLEDRKSMGYNQGARNGSISTAESPHGIENNEQ